MDVGHQKPVFQTYNCVSPPQNVKHVIFPPDISDVSFILNIFQSMVRKLSYCLISDRNFWVCLSIFILKFWSVTVNFQTKSNLGLLVRMHPLPKFGQVFFLGGQQEKFILNSYSLSINAYYTSVDKVLSELEVRSSGNEREILFALEDSVTGKHLAIIQVTSVGFQI